MSTEAVHASPFFLRIPLLWQPSRNRAAIDRALSADGRVRSRLVRCSPVGVLVTQLMSDPRNQEDAGDDGDREVVASAAARSKQSPS